MVKGKCPAGRFMSGCCTIAPEQEEPRTFSGESVFGKVSEKGMLSTLLKKIKKGGALEGDPP